MEGQMDTIVVLRNREPTGQRYEDRAVVTGTRLALQVSVTGSVE